jgi:geranylgeranyl diphosphate synthase type II
MLSGGKRFRPALVLASSAAVGGSEASVLSAAAAVEMIHAFSLVHDDLPSMDNDDLRRGQPTAHKKFGEATAILAGDALLILSFEVLSRVCREVDLSTKQLSDLIETVARAAGHKGMTGGQSLDIESEGHDAGKDLLTDIHRKKTAELIMASCYTGAKLSGARKPQIEDLMKYAYHLGMAFQIKDDILDVAGKPEDTGKTVLSDEKKKKTTFVSVFGLEGSEKMLDKEKLLAVKSLRRFELPAEPLRELAKFVCERNN